MKKEQSYHDRVDINNALKLRELMDDLPSFAFEYFRGIESTTSSKTRIAYGYDLRVFFDYILTYHDAFKDKSIKDVDVEDLMLITPTDIEKFLEYLSYYYKDDKEHQNKERAKARKLASLRTFYNYFYKKQKVPNNPSLLVDLPKIHEKNITRLEVDEVARLLDEVESGEQLTNSQKKFHKHTKDRDMALLTVLLGTGIRVSECVGLDIEDIDFDVNGLKILRKGGNEVIIYFGDEVRDALLSYLEKRNKMIPASGHESALFLSIQNKRLSVRSVQNLVKKYSQAITKLKNISPHKLRSTYGTTLYRETGDIYLVADVLGHKDVNTTKKHYAQIEDERRRQAAKVVKLRD
ncbi:site-specific recombinase XerD [Natranaerovirga hydrolytica]|uniref:Site-specific recombinase XerD n=1 Tax=Natranaerovirga hydrolytica TaxID=680378 RepID=A0A4R1MY04_9FIRM|nr:tyrosine-type recombinase/integrase [Natranaerovirga hydrolytica]TCK98158.1 site-specific recombinase XerD [Natranaerovirga hydrolytica]